MCFGNAALVQQGAVMHGKSRLGLVVGAADAAEIEPALVRGLLSQPDKQVNAAHKVLA